MKYFAPPTQRSLHPNFFFVGFSHIPQQLYQEQACSAVSVAGQRAEEEDERRAVESVKCLIGTRNGGRHLTYPNVCVRHEWISKHFSSPAIFWPSQFKYVHRGFHGPMRINLDLNKKRHDIVDLTFYSYPKQLDAMISYISTLPVKSFWTV